MPDVPIEMAYIVDVPAKESMLCLGYRMALRGDLLIGRAVIVAWLMSVYTERNEEMSTHRFVREIYREFGSKYEPDPREAVPVGIVQAAAGRRFDQLHYPLLASIEQNGYQEDMGGPITMKPFCDHFIAVDGHNRTAILAAMGAKTVPNVRIL